MYQLGLYKAIRHFGSQLKLARALGVSQQAVSQWLNREEKIPYKQIIRIVWATRGAVTQHELAPEEKQTNEIIDRIAQGELTGMVITDICSAPRTLKFPTVRFSTKTHSKMKSL